MTRCLDCLIAALGLTALSPLLAAVAVLSKLGDGGPVFFTQWRVGRYGRPFRIYKFRTMRDGCVTRHGRWLRSTGIDELPQLVNVLRGEMSLIGPRPLTAEDVERLGWDGSRHRLRFSVRPGIAGLAQLYAGRGARLSSFLDARYVSHRGLVMDFQIVAVGAVMMLLGKRRVRQWLRSRRRLQHAQAARSRARPRAEAAARALGAASRRYVLPSGVTASTSLPKWRPSSM